MASQAPMPGRTAVVLAGTFATSGDGARWTITLAPSARITGSTPVTPSAAAADTAARAATAGLAAPLSGPRRQGG